MPVPIYTWGDKEVLHSLSMGDGVHPSYVASDEVVLIEKYTILDT